MAIATLRTPTGNFNLDLEVALALDTILMEEFRDGRNINLFGLWTSVEGSQQVAASIFVGPQSGVIVFYPDAPATRRLQGSAAVAQRLEKMRHQFKKDGILSLAFTSGSDEYAHYA